ncbi:MAG: type II/IV secretion system protein, partial [Desulfobacterales bacterium]|nr:type II/IV secretion system protein [Desulfobacterales bacterium]
MILSTGPTGCGKSTSLYAIVQKLNQPDVNIITLEDPVEYRIEGIEQIQLNRKAGMTFASGLRSILRQDPDTIMVGEIRDSETAQIAVQAALTGHRVLSTLHTNDAAGTIARFIDMGIAPFLISSVLLLSIAQRLVRRVCPECREPYAPPEEALIPWGLDRVRTANFQRGKGCFNCMDTGYQGRVGIFEVLIVDDMIQQMILKGSSAKEITDAAHRAGKLRTLNEDVAEKVAMGITTLEEAMRITPPAEIPPAHARLPEVPGEKRIPTATATVPRNDHAAAVSRPPATPVRRDRILVVDDDETIREYVKTLLEADFFEVFLAVDGFDAMEKILQNPPDLMVIDHMMPKMSGIELIQKLKSHSHLRHMPMIMLTGTAMENTEIEALEAGVDDWIQKPINGPRLLAHIKRRLLQRNQ